jgi:hypothetical protein
MIPAPTVSPELAAAANCAGAFLLAVVFLLLAVTMVALHFSWRGLVVSRRNLPEAMALTLAYIEKLQAGTATTTGALVAPQVTVASRLAGLQVGLRTLVRGRPPAGNEAATVVAPTAGAMSATAEEGAPAADAIGSP